DRVRGGREEVEQEQADPRRARGDDAGRAHDPRRGHEASSIDDAAALIQNCAPTVAVVPRMPTATFARGAVRKSTVPPTSAAPPVTRDDHGLRPGALASIVCAPGSSGTAIPYSAWLIGFPSRLRTSPSIALFGGTSTVSFEIFGSSRFAASSAVRSASTRFAA